VKGGALVLLFDRGDLFDNPAALGQQVHQLLVNAVYLLAQVVKRGFMGRRLHRHGSRPRSWLRIPFKHTRSVPGVSEPSSGSD
jgi:hypothetical protein